MQDHQSGADEYLSNYDDPRDGDQYVSPIGGALGPQRPVEAIPEDNLQEGSMFSFADPATIDAFESKVIARQVPGYDIMRLRALQIGYRFLQGGTAVLDIGTSRGKMIRDLIQVAHELGLPGGHPGRDGDVTYVGIDLEDEMLRAAQASVKGLGDQLGLDQEELDVGVVLRNYDLSQDYGSVPESRGYGNGYSLVTSILTLQFVPIVYRQKIIRSIYENLAPGGALILVEKVIGNSYVTDDLLVNAYHDHKRRNGISEEAINKKRASIERFLVPQRSEENRYLLQQAGFSSYQIETYWRDLNFEGTVAVK